MNNIPVFEDKIKKLKNTYHCDICGSEVKFKDTPLKDQFIICDECKEAINYAKELRKKEVMKNRNSISYKYVDRYFASVDKEDWDGYNKIHHYSVGKVQFPEEQVPDANMYNNDLTYFINYNDAQICSDALNKRWEEVYGK